MCPGGVTEVDHENAQLSRRGAVVHMRKWIAKDLAPPNGACPRGKSKAGPQTGWSAFPSRRLNWLPNKPHAPLPPHHQPVLHTQSLTCKLNMCNTSKSVFLVPETSTPFLGWCTRAPIILPPPPPTTPPPLQFLPPWGELSLGPKSIGNTRRQRKILELLELLQFGPKSIGNTRL